MIKKITCAIALLAGVTLGGCSDIFPYKSADVPENFTFAAQARGGTVRMDIYDLDANCEQKYRGSVRPGNDPVKLGMPLGQQRLVVVVFSSVETFGARHTNSSKLYFKPQPGSTYEIKARYADDIYDVQFREHRGGGWHKVRETVPSACLKSGA